MPRRSRAEWILTAPSLLWLAVFVLVPTILVFVIAFRPANPLGGLGEGWSLDAIRALRDPNYPEIIWRTFWVSALTTIFCLVLALPVAIFMARASPKWRARLLLLIIVPFWTNFLIRILAWKQILHPEGPLKSVIAALGIVSEQTMLLYNPFAVLLVSVYTFLPFAILPLYAAAEKFDFGLLDAARDLGASSWRAFMRVFLPGVRAGLATAFLVVFVPMLGSYVIPDLVGGPAGEMLGNRIAQRNFSDRNLPQAAALSAALTLVVLLPVAWQARRARRE
ncbi:MAG: ABC transporter permease [Verrucomicrobiales bacterium]